MTHALNENTRCQGNKIYKNGNVYNLYKLSYLPSFSKSTTDCGLLLREVKGDTTEASASLSAMPTWAAFRAPQSLPPERQRNMVIRQENIY